MRSDGVRAGDVVRGVSYLLSLNLSAFLRCQFGERVAVDLCLAWGLSWVSFWIYSQLRLTLFPLLPESVVAPWYLNAMLCLTVCHCLEIWLRRNKPADLHSFSTGRPIEIWRRLGFDDLTVKRYLEPLFGALTAYSISRIDLVAAAWIALAAAAVFLREQASRFSTKNHVIDVIDSRMEAEALHKGVQHRLEPASPTTTASTVVEAPAGQSKSTSDTATIVDQLDPELRHILTPANKFDNPPAP